MTVPSLLQDYQKKVYVTQLRKVCNIMTQALLKFQVDKNASNIAEAGLISQDEIDNFVPNYFKLVLTCDDVAEPCFSDKYITINSHSVITAIPKGFKSYLLADGSAIAFKYEWIPAFPYPLVRVLVDLNGKSGPNVYGRDFFGMYIYTNALIDVGLRISHNAPFTKEERESITGFCGDARYNNFDACFGKILNDNWEMTY